MTQDEIIEIASQVYGKCVWHESALLRLEAFTKLVAAKAIEQRTWVGLTDNEMEATFIQCGGKWNGDYWEIEDADFHPFLRTIEAKLKELNT